MSNILGKLRAFASGSLDESALNQNEEAFDFENDEEFMQECMGACMGTMLQMQILGEDADQLDEDVKEAFVKVQDYCIKQGIMAEAAGVTITNPKVNVVHLNKQAQIHRLSTIITLKMARRTKSKNYTKYKLGQKIKKTNMEEMRKRFGSKADALAKKVWEQSKRSAKITTTTAAAKSAKKK